MAVERIAKYNTCCIKSRREMAAKAEIVSENVTPVKPERKSRVSCADLKKSKTDSEVKEEAANLLAKDADTVQQRKDQSEEKEKEFLVKYNGFNIFSSLFII